MAVLCKQQVKGLFKEKWCRAEMSAARLVMLKLKTVHNAILTPFLTPATLRLLTASCSNTVHALPRCPVLFVACSR